jgi:hypothetical protein
MNANTMNSLRKAREIHPLAIGKLRSEQSLASLLHWICNSREQIVQQDTRLRVSVTEWVTDFRISSAVFPEQYYPWTSNKILSSKKPINKEWKQLHMHLFFDVNHYHANCQIQITSPSLHSVGRKRNLVWTKSVKMLHLPTFGEHLEPGGRDVFKTLFRYGALQYCTWKLSSQIATKL